ncbi:hypothetical protein ABS767_15220 [Sphingomonas sp. ST-64]|uniref:Uncharacterized protein n=1 Tax=Sphingomonas plantiphila TaxID=3163295 RepID=A0ABW8YQV1_9SPHN
MMALILSSMALAASPADPVACVLARGGDAARALMKVVPGSSELSPALDRVRPVLTACGAATDGAGLDVLVADMASHLLRTDYAKYPFRALPAASLTQVKAEGLRRETAGWPAADAIGRCVVARDLQGAVKLVRSRKGTRSEGKALDALLPLVPACVDAGASLTASRADLRDGIARALYRDVVSKIPDLWPA